MYVLTLDLVVEQHLFRRSDGLDGASSARPETATSSEKSSVHANNACARCDFIIYLQFYNSIASRSVRYCLRPASSGGLLTSKRLEREQVSEIQISNVSNDW